MFQLLHTYNYLYAWAMRNRTDCGYGWNLNKQTFVQYSGNNVAYLVRFYTSQALSYDKWNPHLNIGRSGLIDFLLPLIAPARETAVKRETQQKHHRHRSNDKEDVDAQKLRGIGIGNDDPRACGRVAAQQVVDGHLDDVLATARQIQRHFLNVLKQWALNTLDRIIVLRLVKFAIEWEFTVLFV